MLLTAAGTSFLQLPPKSIRLLPEDKCTRAHIEEVGKERDKSFTFRYAFHALRYESDETFSTETTCVFEEVARRRTFYCCTTEPFFAKCYCILDRKADLIPLCQSIAEKA